MGKIRDLTGQKFNRLTVIKFAKMDKKNNAMWFCKCDCGKETIVRGYELTSGGTKSCRVPTTRKSR